MLSCLRRAATVTASPTRRRLLQAEARRRVEDEGDWSYSSEWWGSGSPDDGHTLFRAVSDKGNGVVSVVAYPSSTPRQVCWPATENWLRQRYMNIKPPGSNDDERFRILGYQWRVLRFNDNTRQSAVKVLAAYRESDPYSVSFMQQANCLAVPCLTESPNYFVDLKSMVSAGLITLASCKFDLQSIVQGKKGMNVLCIGHGGGSLPLFLATKLQGASVDIVEIDPLVISASIKAMGFPAFSVASPISDHVYSEPSIMDQVIWKGVHERLHLFESDAEAFVQNYKGLYDIAFIDAYDGDDVFPHKLWDPHSPFLKSLSSRLHPEHGTVVVNLHSDSEILDSQHSSVVEPILPMGKYLSKVCRAYKDAIAERGNARSGLGFILSVPWVCNSSLVVCKSSGLGTDFVRSKDRVTATLLSRSVEFERTLNFPFSCLQYLRQRFQLVD